MPISNSVEDPNKSFWRLSDSFVAAMINLYPVFSPEDQKIAFAQIEAKRVLLESSRRHAIAS